ncbi:zinc-dependent peptidase [soil metagenome]
MMLAPLLYLSALLAVASTVLIPHVRLKRAIQRPFPDHFSGILNRNIAAYSKMPPELQRQLQDLVKQFLHQKKFVGCDGMQIDDEVRVTIAGKACMLLLNRKPRVYPGLNQVLVYPSSFVAPRKEIGVAGVVTHADQNLAGESWSDGRVILAWDHVLQSTGAVSNGHNVVLHEFAHQLDSETGGTNGAPWLPSRARYQRWSTVLSTEFEKLQRAAQIRFESPADVSLDLALNGPIEAGSGDYLESSVEPQVVNVIDFYGATNPAEFFAVATETFFEKPQAMRDYHPALYVEFKKYYRIDPCNWH